MMQRHDMLAWAGKVPSPPSLDHAPPDVPDGVSASATATFTTVHHVLGVDGGESVITTAFVRGIVESSQPASDVKPMRVPTLTTRWS